MFTGKLIFDIIEIAVANAGLVVVNPFSAILLVLARILQNTQVVALNLELLPKL
jgi:seryl-tRNA(Sec) selenium transferase